MTGGTNNTENSQQIKLPGLHKGQIAARKKSKRFNHILAGRRWRKTSLAVSIATEGALAGDTVVWGSPTNDQNRIAFNELSKAVRDCPIVVLNKSLLTAEFNNSGGRVVFKSLDEYDHVRGFTANKVIIDEFPKVKKEAWTEALSPLLIDTQGEAWMFGTPYGKNWAYYQCLQAMSRFDSMFFQAPTLGCYIKDGKLYRKYNPYENPDIPFDEMVRAFETIPERTFRQEYLAEFIDNAGGAFNVNRETFALWQKEPLSNHTYVMGIDLAQTHDYTVVSVIDMSVYPYEVINYERFNGAEYSVQATRIKQLADKFRPTHILVDITGVGKGVIERIEDEFYNSIPLGNTTAYMPIIRGFTFTAVTKPQLMKSLIIAIEKNELLLPQDEYLQQEFTSYEVKQSKDTGRLNYSAPDGYFDDVVCSVALAFQLASSSSFKLLEYYKNANNT